MKNILLSIILLLPILLVSQEKEKKFGIKFSGFVKTDIFFDSRQTADARDGQFLLYPKNEYFDINGDDINAQTQFDMLSIQTRLKGTITGPDVWGAKTSGLIEGAFFGNIGTDINGFRLRHAFVKLAWKKSELLVGQFWHPMFVTACFPGTVSFNTGVPFQPFARNPQVRFTKKFGKVNLIGAALTQIDFADTGPIGPNTSYLINSSIPEFNFRLEYKSENLFFGAGANYKVLMPRLFIDSEGLPDGVPVTEIKTNETVSGISFFGYFKAKTKPLTIKLYGVMGQSMFSMINLGGYAESGTEAVVMEDGKYSTELKYTPFNTNSFWTDIHTNGKTWQFGLFGGYSINGGTKDDIKGAVYARGSNIDYVYRISPRVIYNNGKFRIAPEIEYTVAAYAKADSEGNMYDDKGKVTNSNEIGNFRFLIGVYFFF